MKGECRMYNKILVASDGSGPSMKAALIAGELAKAFAAQLTVVTVAYLPKIYATDLGSEMREGYVDEWKRVLDNTVKTVKEQGVEPGLRLLREEEPAGAVLEEVKRGGYDLLVVGRTGAGAPGSAMMGGVSRKIAEAAACAVLLVR
jgi:nucleotide-binding universal stress UspA family protein